GDLAVLTNPPYAWLRSIAITDRNRLEASVRRHVLLRRRLPPSLFGRRYFLERAEPHNGPGHGIGAVHLHNGSADLARRRTNVIQPRAFDAGKLRRRNNRSDAVADPKTVAGSLGSADEPTNDAAAYAKCGLADLTHTAPLATARSCASCATRARRTTSRQRGPRACTSAGSSSLHRSRREKASML